MAGWHHWLNEHEREQTLGDNEGQGSLARCSPWGCKEWDTTQLLNNNIALNACIRKQERLETNELSVNFKQLWKKAIKLTHRNLNNSNNGKDRTHFPFGEQRN